MLRAARNRWVSLAYDAVLIQQRFQFGDRLLSREKLDVANTERTCRLDVLLAVIDEYRAARSA